MPEFDTDRAPLPVPLGRTAPRPSLARGAPMAAFVSQLLAARDHLPPQRARRLGSPENAVGAYARGARMAVRRMPQGFRKNLTV